MIKRDGVKLCGEEGVLIRAEAIEVNSCLRKPSLEQTCRPAMTRSIDANRRQSYAIGLVH